MKRERRGEGRKSDWRGIERRGRAQGNEELYKEEDEGKMKEWRGRRMKTRRGQKGSA